MSTNELRNKIIELKELKAMQEELQAEIKAIEDCIKAEMTSRETEEMQVDIFKIRWTKVISNRFDTNAFKSMHIELYNAYIRQTESRRFTVA